jgi:energy-coupling factor transporter ATP-binding protein EcfA2
MTEDAPINLMKLIDFQSKEQYRTLLITGPAGSGKTKYAKLLAQAIKAQYIDLLDIFAGNTSLSDNIDLFNVPRLKKYLLDLPSHESVIIVDNIDFLLNTWTDRELAEFLNLVEKLRSNETKKVFCFFVQDLKIFNTKQIHNSQNNSRIITLNQVAHIKEEDNL